MKKHLNKIPVNSIYTIIVNDKDIEDLKKGKNWIFKDFKLQIYYQKPSVH